MRQDLLTQGVVGVEGGTRLLALADEDGVEDDLGELVGLQGLGDDADGRRGTEHADLDGVDLAVDGGGGLDLIMNDLRIDRHESVSPVVVGVEGDDAGQGRASEHPELVEGLEVGLGSGATGGLGPGNG